MIFVEYFKQAGKGQHW